MDGGAGDPVASAQMRRGGDAVAANFFRKQQGKLAGLDLTFRFKLPGNVLRHTRNMKQTAANEVVAKVTAAQIRTPEDLVRRLAPRFQVVFDARGCTIPIDR